MEQNKKGNILKTIGFTLLVVVLFGIVLILIVRSEERWFAYVILAASAGSLVFFRRKSFWHGFRVFLSWIAAYTIAWIALFAGQSLVDIQPYTTKNLEQPSASYQLLLNNLTIVDTRTGNLTSNYSLNSIKEKLSTK